MKVAVNTRLLLKNKLEGIGWFTYENFKRITQSYPEHEFLFFFDRPFHEDYIFSNNITPVVISPQARHPFLWYWWFEQAIPRALRKYNADIFVSPDGYSSLNTQVKTLPVIHDINFEHHTEVLPYFTDKFYKHYFPKYAQKSTRVATVSEYSKKDIAKTYNISLDKVDVVYNGVGEHFKPVNDFEQNKVKSIYTEGEDYFIFVGALNPRKNLVGLFQAFDEFKQKTETKTKLLIVGEKMFWPKEIESTFHAMQHNDDVVFSGRLEGAELNSVMASAKALAFPSFFEGFGIPIAEAMRCGTPVITSTTTSMPEVAGDAALLVDPHSIDSISNAMLEIEKNQELAIKLREKGFIRSQEFSWDKSAEKLWQSIEKTVG